MMKLVKKRENHVCVPAIQLTMAAAVIQTGDMVGWFACKYHMVEKSPVVHPIRHLHNVCVCVCVCVNIIFWCVCRVVYHPIYLNVLTRVRCHDTLSFQNARLFMGGIGSCSCCFFWLQHDDDVRAWANVVVAVVALRDKVLLRARGVLNDCNVVNDMRCDWIRAYMQGCLFSRSLWQATWQPSYLSSSEWDICFWELCASTQYLE